MWSIPVSPPRSESLAIPDAGWSAEPAWPETIRDPRGGCTSQWAPRPWLKHQPLSMPRWREEGEKGGRGDHKKRWRDSEFSSISCLCSWLKEGFVHHFMSWRKVGLYCTLTHTAETGTCKAEPHMWVYLWARRENIPTLTHKRTCIRPQQPVDYHGCNVAISFDICGFDMYLNRGRFR